MPNLNQEYFERIFTHHPELLLFLTKNPPQQDLEVKLPEEWADCMYKAVEVSLANKGNKPEYLSRQLESIPQQAKSRDLERSMRSIIVADTLREESIAEHQRVLTEQVSVDHNVLTVEQAKKLKAIAQQFSSLRVLRTHLLLRQLYRQASLRQHLIKPLSINDPQIYELFLDKLIASAKKDEVGSVLPSVNLLSEDEFKQLGQNYFGFSVTQFVRGELSRDELNKLNASIMSNWQTIFIRQIFLYILELAGDLDKKRLDVLLDITNSLEAGKPTASQIYHHYLTKRLEFVSLYPIKDPHKPQETDQEKESSKEKLLWLEQWLGPFVCLLEINTEEEGKELRTALDKLYSKKAFRTQLANWKDYQLDNTTNPPINISVFLIHLLRQSTKTGFTVTLRIGVAIISNTLNKHRKQHDKRAPVDFSSLMGMNITQLNKVSKSEQYIAIGVDGRVAFHEIGQLNEYCLFIRHHSWQSTTTITISTGGAGLIGFMLYGTSGIAAGASIGLFVALLCLYAWQRFELPCCADKEEGLPIEAPTLSM